MNIFATDPDPVKSAKSLDDKRVIKMTLESAQMLCTALHMHGASHLAKYRKTHPNHPCNIWVRETRSNYEWLLAHFVALSDEYTTISGKVHASFDLYDDLKTGASFVPPGPLTSMANCAARQDMNINYKHLKDVHLAYKLYLIDRWSKDKRSPMWRGTHYKDAPDWVLCLDDLSDTLNRFDLYQQ